MDIELVYFSEDPMQVEARDFLKDYVARRGILARIIESDQPVDSLTVTVNGQSLTDLRKDPRRRGTSAFPRLEDIARMVERQAWCL